MANNRIEIRYVVFPAVATGNPKSKYNARLRQGYHLLQLGVPYLEAQAGTDVFNR